MTQPARIITFIGKDNSNSNSNLNECAKCGKEFSSYIDIVSKNSGRNKTKRFHISCAKELNII